MPLLQPVWVFVPTFRHAILFDLLVVFPAIPLLLLRRTLRLGNWNQRCINDLPATGMKSLRAEIGLKLFKQLFDYSSLRKPFSKKARVVASGIAFITPKPTNSSKERRSFIWTSVSSTASGRLRPRSN
jgi:hypothetical protein